MQKIEFGSTGLVIEKNTSAACPFSASARRRR